MKDIIQKIKELDDRDSQSLKEEYKEWLEAIELGDKHPHVLYMNHKKSNS